MKVRISALSAALGLALAGCSADGTLSTASINGKPETKVAAVDPACIALSNQIEVLRAEGSVEGLEKASTGKGGTVKVKREALAKQAELNRTYADYQAKCGIKLPQSAQMSQVPAVAPIAAAPAAAAKTQ
jgi:hypothetical protein